jgi:hypothetical protein
MGEQGLEILHISSSHHLDSLDISSRDEKPVRFTSLGLLPTEPFDSFFKK